MSAVLRLAFKMSQGMAHGRERSASGSFIRERQASASRKSDAR